MFKLLFGTLNNVDLNVAYISEWRQFEDDPPIMFPYKVEDGKVYSRIVKNGVNLSYDDVSSLSTFSLCRKPYYGPGSELQIGIIKNEQ